MSSPEAIQESARDVEAPPDPELPWHRLSVGMLFVQRPPRLSFRQALKMDLSTKRFISAIVNRNNAETEVPTIEPSALY